MQDSDALSDPWFVQTEPFELELEFPSLKPKLAGAVLLVAAVVLGPLVYAAIAMT